jgi:hypothetical protein
MLAAVLLVALPSVTSAAPCLPGSLSDYIGLGGTGCDLHTATVAAFSSAAAPGAVEVDAAAISVTPIVLIPVCGCGFTVGLSFQLIGAAAAGEVKGNGIGYSIGGPTLNTRRLSLAGTSVQPDGAITALQLAPDPLIVFDIGTDAELFATAPLVPGTFFDVFTEITLDGGLAGFAGLDVTVTETFDHGTIPEPAGLGLFGTGLGALAWRRAARIRGRAAR